jgi:hypothetical protein
MEFGINMSEDFILKHFLLQATMGFKLKQKKMNSMKEIC